jgi:hypothetical protein
MYCSLKGEIKKVTEELTVGLFQIAAGEHRDLTLSAPAS